MLKIMITGSEGVIGRALEFEEHDVYRLDIRPSAEFVCDITKRSELDKVFEAIRPDVVIHLAAKAEPSTSFVEIDDDLITNILGTVNVLECMVKYGVGLIVFTSTCAVYGDLFKKLRRPLSEADSKNAKPVSPYGVSKRACEEYIELYSRQFGVNYVILRLGNVYSPYDDKYLLWKLYENRDRFVMYGRGMMVRDFVYVGDVNALFRKILSLYERGWKKRYNGVYNVGHEPKRVCDVVWKFREIMGYPKEVVETEKRLGEFDEMNLDCSRVKKTFDWSPKVRMFEEGIELVLDGFKRRSGM